MWRYLLSISVLLCVSCNAPKQESNSKDSPGQTANTANSDFDKLTDDLIYGSLALSPVSATQTGYHEHNGVQLDEMIDDFSPAGIEAQRKFYEDFRNRADAWNPSSLDKEQASDLQIIKTDLNLYLLDLNTIQSYKHNPTVYVELAGNAIFVPSILNYAPLDRRYHAIIKRLEKFPTLFAQAKANLVDAPEIWNKVAREENAGNIDLIDKELRSKVPEAQKNDYDRAAGPALMALKDFTTFLENDLSKKTSDWRLGKEKYALKFEYTLATGKTPEQLLAEAEGDLKKTRDELTKLAAPKTVQAALDEIA